MRPSCNLFPRSAPFQLAQRFLPALLLLLGLMYAGRLDAQSAEIIPEAEFWALIETLERFDSSDSEEQAIIEQIGQLSAVETSQGDVIAIDGATLASRLELEGYDRQLLNEWLALRDGPRAQPQPDSIAELEAILARPEFAEQVEEVGFWERIWRPILDWFFENFNPNARLLGAWGYLVAGLFAIGLAVFLWFWIRSLRRQFSAETASPFDNDSDLNLSSSTALQEAQAKASGGDYREAVRYLYLSTLLNLDERDQLKFDRSKTNREYLRQVSGTAFAATLGSVIDVFDRVWYGFQPIDETTYRRYEQQVKELQR